MRLIWTYDSNSKNLSIKDKITLINYYILSIIKAKKFTNCKTIMYCDLYAYNIFKSIVDEIHLVNQSYHNSPLWDNFKILALSEQIDSNYYLIDGDIILHNELPMLESDVIFDSYEILNWKNEYQPTINVLNELGIDEIIPEWTGEKLPVMNCGILNIKNKNHRDLYIQKWKDFNAFVIDNIDKIDTKYATAVGAQYLLTLICKKYNIQNKKICSNFGEIGDYYKHYFGTIKFTNGLVPSNYIIKIENDKKEIIKYL
jgi:hypothetical protein